MQNRNPESIVGAAMVVLALVFAALVLCSCATAPGASVYTFESAPPQGPALARVVVEHHMAPLAEVIATCTMKVREATGVKLAGDRPPLACSWREHGVNVALCAEPRDFNDHAVIEACGHEDIHFHNRIDHK